LRDGAWVRDLRGRVPSGLLDIFVSFRALLGLAQLSPGVEDRFTWRFSSDGAYSAASAYRIQFVGAVDSTFVPLIWKPWAALPFLRLALCAEPLDDGGQIAR
jgi:hypothetical protein